MGIKIIVIFFGCLFSCLFACLCIFFFESFVFRLLFFLFYTVRLSISSQEPARPAAQLIRRTERAQLWTQMYIGYLGDAQAHKSPLPRMQVWWQFSVCNFVFMASCLLRGVYFLCLCFELKHFNWLKLSPIEFELINQRALLEEHKRETFTITNYCQLKILHLNLFFIDALVCPSGSRHLDLEPVFTSSGQGL